ncbi:MAG: Trk system potassium transporter TrkA [Candidatus Coatesbacteria bacterium]|nr:Trk system potassium transporter TrkA [Candidatus Coatesbacteria bacterium]
MKVVIVGAGEVGFHIASRLAHENKDVVVIDNDPEAIRRVSESTDVQALTGSGSSPIVLSQAGIEEAAILLAVTNSDETNLAACLVADTLSPSIKKLARIRDADFDKYHDAFRNRAPHIDTIINPEIEVVRTIEQLMSVPGAVDVGEFADSRVKFIGIHMDKGARLAGMRLSEISSRIGKQGPLIATVIRDEQLIIPGGNDRLMPGDLVYFICEEAKLLETLSVFDKHAQPLRRALIAGGGRTGFRLAALLESKSISTKIIERDPHRCDELAAQLSKTIVLNGDCSDRALLREENIQDMDVVVTLTDDEETNILAALLAKQMGARKVIAKVSTFSYIPLMTSIGLEQVVSPRLSAINTILQHIRRGKVLSAISIKGEQAEVMEAVAAKGSGIVGRSLKKVSFPRGVLVIGAIRGSRVIIPSGDSVIEPEDRVIVFARRGAVLKVEEILAMKPKYS